jgi:L,D-peptidoglycan transpeptidase YkuD (ErfK/YbiS/YcfS/YnhG family)
VVARLAQLVTAGALALAAAGCSAAPAQSPAAPRASAIASPTTGPSLTPTVSATPTLSATPTPSPPKPVATPSKRPSPTTAPKPAAFRFPVPVVVGNATQVVTVQSHGSYATVAAWQYSAGGWHRVLSTTSARVGANGVVPAAVRKQGTNTTPGGTFTLTQAFGIKADPGTALSYHQVTSHDWWVEDNNSAYYNQMRTDTQGGFNMTLPESNVNGSEHLITHTVPYQYAVVINYNRSPAVPYKGAGIFLHVNGAGSTAGCVSVPLATMVELLRWLTPAGHPRIAID